MPCLAISERIFFAANSAYTAMRKVMMAGLESALGRNELTYFKATRQAANKDKDPAYDITEGDLTKNMRGRGKLSIETHNDAVLEAADGFKKV